jgi:MFS transporter, ACS family, solute carrier family 17 (sodium-dependent inorganic phosphate cotransporter), other
MKDPAVWALITAHFCFNWGYYTLLSWLPSYFDLALGLKVDKSSIFTLIPYLAMVVMTPFVGPTADGLIAQGVPVTRVRKLCQGLSLVGPAICMAILAVLTPNNGVTGAVAGSVSPAVTWGVVALLSVAFALSAWARAGLYCNHQDMSPKYVPFCSIFNFI